MTPNLSTEEIQKFDEISTHWWDANGPCKPLHDINSLRLQFIQERSTLANSKIIDIGCGGGILSESLAKAGAAHVIGIDMSEKAIQAAQMHWNNTSPHFTNLTYQRTTAEAMAEQHPQAFDIVTCLELLEHVPDPSSILKACATLVKPGGSIFLSTINRTAKAYLLAILGAEYFLNMLPKGTHDFAKFIRPHELAAWVRAAGLTIVEFKGMHYNPFTHKYNLNKDISVNYLVHCRRED